MKSRMTATQIGEVVMAIFEGKDLLEHSALRNEDTVEPLVRPDEIDKVAFDGPNPPDRGYTIRASYLKAPRNGDALIEVMKDGQPLRRFLFPAYKIYNLQAHFRDIVDGEIAKSASGYEMAAWDGISGLSNEDIRKLRIKHIEEK